MVQKRKRISDGPHLKKDLDPDEKYVTRKYLHPRYSGSLSALNGFLKNNNYSSPQKVDEILSSLDAYVSHKPARKRFPRRPMIVPKINSVWSMDLADMQNLKKSNKNYGYILVAVDCLSKRVYTHPLKKKSQHETASALQSIFRKSKETPKTIFSDAGREFVNKSVKDLLNSHGIRLYHSFSYLKAFHAERMIRTLKSRLYRFMTAHKNNVWITSLDNVTTSLNNSYNASIGTTPNKVSKKNESEVWQKLYHKIIMTKKMKPKFKVGDKVRVSVKKLSVGSKSYTRSFGPEIFNVSEVQDLHPVPVFKLTDHTGLELEAGFNQFELASYKG
jgi:hypothetical protein